MDEKMDGQSDLLPKRGRGRKTDRRKYLWSYGQTDNRLTDVQMNGQIDGQIDK